MINQQWQQLHEKFVEYGRNAKEWMRKCVLLLPEIEKHKIWQRKGFENIYEYARQIAGMSRFKVDESLRILRRIQDKPALLKVAEEKGLQRVRPVAAISTVGDQKFWAEKAQIMSKHPLEAYVKNYRQEILPEEGTQSSKSNSNPKFKPYKEIIMQLDILTAEELEKLKGQSDWNTLMKEFLELRKQKMEIQKPKAIQAKSRAIPSSIRKHVLGKTRSTCAFPGCNKKAEILHHTDRFAMYGIHDPDTIVPLCKAHERLAHLGLIANENEAAKFWKVLKYPDQNNPKYEIDRMVEKYRKTFFAA